MNRRSMQLDFSGIRIYSATNRHNLVRIDNLKVPGETPEPEWGGVEFDALVEHIDAARKGGRQIIFSVGEHVIKCGLSRCLGSGVIGPEVFLKALSIARNLGYPTFNITTANFDLIDLGDFRRPLGYEHPSITIARERILSTVRFPVAAGACTSAATTRKPSQTSEKTEGKVTEYECK